MPLFTAREEHEIERALDQREAAIQAREIDEANRDLDRYERWLESLG